MTVHQSDPEKLIDKPECFRQYRILIQHEHKGNNTQTSPPRLSMHNYTEEQITLCSST